MSDHTHYNWFNGILTFFLNFAGMTPLQLIDTHCHLYVDAFHSDIQQVIKRAQSDGVQRFMLPAIDSAELNNLLELEKNFPNQCFAMMGLHPCSVKDNYQSELDLVNEWLNKRKFIAIGECGLDYYWDKTHVAEQKKALHQQMEWALQYDLPIILHTRNAIDDCIAIAKEHQNGKLRGIFHCFGDNIKEAEQIMELGFYMGIGGVLTYKNSGLAETVKSVPMEYLVLETDAPYLTPVPFRGKRNESSYLKYIVTKLAECKNISEQEVANITTANAEKLFRL